MREELVGVIPIRYIHLEYNEEADEYFAFKSFEVVFVQGATENNPARFTDKECCSVEVRVGMLLIEPYLSDLERNGFTVLIKHTQHH